MEEGWRCVEDSSATHYNQILDISQVKKSDWSSAELMLRKDHLYKWGFNVEQNFPKIKPGCGSCIFLHLWRKPGSPTEGCTAMSEEHVLTLLSWLDPDSKPLMIQIPQLVFDRYQA